MTTTAFITASNSSPTAVVNAENTAKIAKDTIKPSKGENQENGFHTSPLDIGDAMDVDPMPSAAKTPLGLNPAGADITKEKPQSTDKGNCKPTVEQPNVNLRTGGSPTATRPPEASSSRPIGQGHVSGPAGHAPSHIHPMDIDSEVDAAGLPPRAVTAVDQDSVASVSTGERGVQGNQRKHTSTAGTAPRKRNRVRKGKETKAQPGLKKNSVPGGRPEVLEKQKLMVKLKIPPRSAIGGTHVGPKQGSLPKTAVSSRTTPVPQTPIWPVPTPPNTFTTINDLLKKPPPIPRPQPYHNPNTSSRPAATPKQIAAPPAPPPPPPPPPAPPATNMGAPHAARIRAEKTKGPKTQGSIGANIPAPLPPPSSAGIEFPISPLTAQREIPPRPAYWKPDPRPGASVTNFATSTDAMGLDMPASETPEGALDIATVGVRLTARNPLSLPNRSNYWYSADGNQNL